MDERMPKFCIPNFSKAWWQKIFWVLEGSFFWQLVLALWPVCFSLVAVSLPPLVASCFLLRDFKASHSISAPVTDAFPKSGPESEG